MSQWHNAIYFGIFSMPTFGDELKRLRIERGLSQAALATAVGMDQGFLSQIETGQRQGLANVGQFFRIAEALGVTADHFRPFVMIETEEEPIQAKPKRKKKSS